MSLRQVALNGFFKLSPSTRDTTNADNFETMGTWSFGTTTPVSSASPFAYRFGEQLSDDLVGGHCMKVPGSIDQGKGQCTTVEFTSSDVVTLAGWTNSELKARPGSADKVGNRHTEHMSSVRCTGDHQFIHKINTKAPGMRGDWFESVECCELEGNTQLFGCQETQVAWMPYGGNPMLFGADSFVEVAGSEVPAEYSQAHCPGKQVMAGFDWFFASAPTREGGLDKMKCCSIISLMPRPPPQPQPPPSPAPPPAPRAIVRRKITGEICLSLSEDNPVACITMSLTPQIKPFTVALGGAYDKGDMRPLSFLGEGMADVLVLKANSETPLVLNLLVDLNAVYSAYVPGQGSSAPTFVTFDLSGTAFINLNKFRLPRFELSTAAVGELSSSGALKGAFVVEADKIELPGFGELPGGVAMSFSVLPHAYLKFLGEERYVPNGGGLYWRGTPKTLAGLCAADIMLNLTFQTTPDLAIMGFFQCPAHKVMFDRREPAESFFKPLIPSVQYVRLSAMRIGAGIRDGKAAFELGAVFQMATLNPNLDAPADDVCSPSSTSALCIKGSFTSTLDLKMNMAPLGLRTQMWFGLETETTGMWLDPLGLTNFAIADVKLALNLKLDVTVGVIPAPPYVSVVSFLALPGRVGWASTMYWKRYGSWPDAMIDKAAGWPPDLSSVSDQVHF